MRIVYILLIIAFAAACGSGTPPSEPFVESADVTGLDFWHASGASGDFYLPEITGSGVALIDYDSDGDLDVFFAQGGALDGTTTAAPALRPPPATWKPGNRLYRNDLVPGAALLFTDVSDQAGDLGRGFAMGAAVGDIDNDGDADLFVTSVRRNTMLRNDSGRFVDVTDDAGLQDQRWNASASFSDYDNDGDLDLFVTAYVADPVERNRVCRNQADQPDYCSPSNFDPLPDRLYQNDGNGRFRDVSAQAGIASPGAGLGVVAADFDLDGAIDFYVANDQTANHLWLNQGDGTFNDQALMAGAAYNADGRAEASMGLTSGDYDGDGDEDLFMTHLNTETNTLYRNDGHGNFSDATDRANLGAGSLQYTGWGAHWFDVDHDRDLDLYIVNGAVMRDAAGGNTHPYGQRNQLWLNNDGHYTVQTPGASATVDIDNSRGAAFGDLDNDGDIDVVVNNNDGPARLYLNQTDQQRHHLSIVLLGPTGKPGGTGARVAVMTADQPAMWRRAGTDGSFASANDPRVHVGLGMARSADIGVIWPGGQRERWRDIAADQYVTLTQGSGEPWP